MIAIINLLTNILITGTSIIGCTTIISKIGKFCKIIEDSKDDGFKFAFDNLMMESIDDMNKCIDSITIISSNLNNLIFVLYDIIVGNKYIKKNKEGKLIITNKTKLYSNYKEKIDELNNKLKAYQDEIKKIKLKNNNSKKILSDKTNNKTDINITDNINASNASNASDDSDTNDTDDTDDTNDTNDTNDTLSDSSSDSSSSDFTLNDNNNN